MQIPTARRRADEQPTKRGAAEGDHAPKAADPATYFVVDKGLNQYLRSNAAHRKNDAEQGDDADRQPELVNKAEYGYQRS